MTVNIKRTFSTLNCSKLKNNAARLAFAPLQNNAARLASLGVLHIAHVHTILQTSLFYTPHPADHHAPVAIPSPPLPV